MEDMTLCSPEHQEVFQRVWQRVMEGRTGEGCPVEVTAAQLAVREVTGDMDCDYLKALAQAERAQDDRAQAGPRAPRPADLPVADEAPVPCGECTCRLRQQIMDALEGWQFYRHLARRTRSGTARTLTALAGAHHKQARRLSAAYFLLTGLRYWPSEQLGAPVISSFWGALRQRHQAEQQMEQSYRMAAEDSEDPALRELYAQLADDCQAHCRQLRAMLEQSCP